MNPSNACANDIAFAQDGDSGTGSPHQCDAVTKDRHLFYDYGFAIPAGSVIDGVEVRLDAWADAASGSSYLCVELSWDGGTTWTVDKRTPNLGTSEATYTLGSVSDDWDRQWSAGEFSDVNFRVRVLSRSTSESRDFFLDWVAVQVTYTLP